MNRRTSVWVLSLLMVFGSSLSATASRGAQPPAAPRPSAARPVAPPTVRTPRIYVLDCGTLLDTDPAKYQIGRNQVTSTTMADMCFLVVHPGGTLLWDTGITDKFAGRGPVEMSRGIKFLKTDTLIGQLAQIGYTPNMITYLALSHHHLDHSGNADIFAANATWLVAQAEWNVMFGSGEPPVGAENFSRLKSAKTIFVEDDYDVFRDGTVVIKRAVGHTPGHSVLQVRLRNRGPVVLAGDLWHYPEELMFNLMPKPEETLGTSQSRAKVIDLAKRIGAPIWTSHDREVYRNLPRAPAYID